MKILAFVDSHTNKLAYAALRDKAKQADLVLCAGDISIFGLEMMEALEEMNSWNKPVFFIHGNHEDEDMLADVNDHFPNLHFVHKKEKEFNGLVVWGYGGGGFSTVDRELDSYVKKFSHTPNRIIMFHGPPFGTEIDFKNEYEGHVGCKSRRKAIDQLKPIIAIAGHIHECFNKFEKLGNTLVINPGPLGKLITINDPIKQTTKKNVKKTAAKKKK